LIIGQHELPLPVPILAWQLRRVCPFRIAKEVPTTDVEGQ
jgi:hypothetical protein